MCAYACSSGVYKARVINTFVCLRCVARVVVTCFMAKQLQCMRQ